MVLNTARSDVNARKRGKEMSDVQLTAFLGRKIYQAMNDEHGDLSQTRQDLFDRYNGELYGSERKGYSKFTTREGMEVVEWIMPALLRIFTGSDRVVSFDPVGPEDEDAAEQETDLVNHKVMKANGGDGFIALHNFIKDAVMFPTSYCKAYVEEETRSVTRQVKGLPAPGLLEFVDEKGEPREGIEILEQDSYTKNIPTGVVGMDGLPQYEQIECFNLKIRETTTREVLRIESMPGEESLVDNDCTTVNLDHADFVCHRTRKSYTALVNMGIDPEDLDDVGTYEDYQWNDERTNRLFYVDENPDAEDEDDPSMRQFWVHEITCMVDFDGDGVAEQRRILMVGAKILENEETDYQGVCAMSATMIPHKHTGLSVMQMVVDLQELMTTLTRQLLDNIYKINVRRKIISEDSLLDDGTTMRAMLNTQSEWIPVRGPAQGAIMPEQTQSMAAELLPVLQHVGNAVSMRSGVAPENNVDPNVLQQTTAGAFMGAMEKAGERVELIARVMAETGIKQLFRKVHQLCRMYPDIMTTVKLRGKWVPVNTMEWRDRTDMSVNVGLGFNDKQTMVALLTQLLAMQREAMGANMADEARIFHTLEKWVEATGVGAVEQFFLDPTKPGWQRPEPPPDPSVILANAQAQALGSEQQLKAYEAQAKLPLEQQKMSNDAMKAQADAQGKAADNELKHRELAIKERELAIKERELEIRAAEAVAGIDNTNADTAVKETTALQNVVGSGKTAAEVAEIRERTSEEHQAAREILDEMDNYADEDEDMSDDESQPS